MEIIAHMRTDFPTKFGVPRQSGLAHNLCRIEFCGVYRNPDAIRGIEGFSHLWVLWLFSENKAHGFCATVRPPRLGGNTRMGVFATRSPYRPNDIGLSCVRLVKVMEDGSLLVEGADMTDGTPVIDIKPYLPFADSHPEATGGFAEEVRGKALSVVFPKEQLSKIPQEKQKILLDTLSQDPRPHYQKDASRIYGMPFCGMDVHFKVENDVLTVVEITNYS